MRFPLPDLKLSSIYELRPEMLKARGIELLLLDLDNTLAPYSADAPSPALISWVRGMESAGIKLFILSNNKGERPKIFGEALGLSYLSRSKKPKTEMLLKVLSDCGTAPEHAAIMGDQIFTDVLCGVRAGVFSIAVKPLSLLNPFFLLRYAAELPFRRERRK